MFGGAAGLLLLFAKDAHDLTRQSRTTLMRDADKVEVTRRVPRSEPKREATESIMPDYGVRGDITVRGFVVDLKDAPCPNVRVLCYPDRFQSLPVDVRARVTGRSDSRGYFEVSGLARRSRYYYLALDDAGRYARGRVRLRDVEQGPIRIRVVEHSYQRYAFVNDAGEPVPVLGLDLGIDSRWATFSTERRASQAADYFFVGTLGLAVAPAVNEVVIVDGAPPDVIARVDGEQAPDVEIDIPGYEPHRLLRRRFAISEWPKATTVRLTRRHTPDNRAVFRVEYPCPEWSVRWSDWDPALDPGLTIVMESLGTGILVSRFANRFVALRNERFRIAMNGSADAIPYQVDKAGDEHVIRPRLPPMCFLSVQCPAGGRSGDGARVGVIVLRGSVHLRGRWVNNTVARFGPIPPGEYELARLWKGQRNVGVGPDDRLSVAIREGHNVVSWE